MLKLISYFKFAILFTLLLCACSDIFYPPKTSRVIVPATLVPLRTKPLFDHDVLTEVEHTRNYRIVDKGSFVRASVLYPTRTLAGHYAVPVGEYFSSKIAVTLPQNADISLIRLEGFESKCACQGPDNLQLWCTTICTTTVIAGGTERHISVTDYKYLGQHYIYGDFNPALTYVEVDRIHKNSQVVIDNIVQRIQQQFSGRK